jgi:hypothetical protein
MKKLVFILLSIAIIISCKKEQILEDSNISNLGIYPSPSTGVFTVNFRLQKQDYLQTVDINIINKFGEVLATEELVIPLSLPIDSADTTVTSIIEVGGPSYNIMFNLENTPKGIYFVEIVTKDGFLRKELILLN